MVGLLMLLGGVRRVFMRLVRYVLLRPLRLRRRCAFLPLWRTALTAFLWHGCGRRRGCGMAHLGLPLQFQFTLLELSLRILL